ncbi:TetR/AcrR family transcriptional regulator [Paenibacillus lemnae]|uniref:TetR/AcrR family transcriptional regulator n=1 Tax=Paenibacillus lemnae TaxID=1330551 RepID=A0A848M7C9_PAELE|nr:TetR-like C-terminal domain-containing protein [Paenibacillus lemnae]NMO97098.1 TetR/AcrR family transcriptional regulator [Paenibacillus lemnae]
MTTRNNINLDKIIQAAAEIIDVHGLENLTLSNLSQKLKIRSPSLYNHIKGLQDIRRLLSLHGLKQLLSVLTRAAVGRSSDEAMREMAKAYLRFARKHPGLYEVTHMAPSHSDHDLYKTGQEIVDLVTQVLEAYQMEPTDTIHIARAFRSQLHGFASLEQRRGFGMSVDLDDSFMHMIDTLLAGLHVRYPKDGQRPSAQFQTGQS